MRRQFVTLKLMVGGRSMIILRGEDKVDPEVLFAVERALNQYIERKDIRAHVDIKDCQRSKITGVVNSYLKKHSEGVTSTIIGDSLGLTTEEVRSATKELEQSGNIHLDDGFWFYKDVVQMKE